MGLAARTLTACLVAAALALCAQGHPGYQQSIPNGQRVMRNGVPAPGVGHVSLSGGGPRNAFGLAFVLASYRWTTALCQEDSDGDGFTNGQELGDPDCVWRAPSAVLNRTTDITHPGYADSFPSNLAPGRPNPNATSPAGSTTAAPPTVDPAVEEDPGTGTIEPAVIVVIVVVVVLLLICCAAFILKRVFKKTPADLDAPPKRGDSRRSRRGDLNESRGQASSGRYNAGSGEFSDEEEMAAQGGRAAARGSRRAGEAHASIDIAGDGDVPANRRRDQGLGAVDSGAGPRQADRTAGGAAQARGARGASGAAGELKEDIEVPAAGERPKAAQQPRRLSRVTTHAPAMDEAADDARGAEERRNHVGRAPHARGAPQAPVTGPAAEQVETDATADTQAAAAPRHDGQHVGASVAALPETHRGDNRPETAAHEAHVPRDHPQQVDSLRESEVCADA